MLQNLPPVIKWFHLEKDDLCFEYRMITAKERILRCYVNEFIPASVKETKEGVFIQVPQKEGPYRVFLFVYDGKDNVSSFIIFKSRCS